MTDADRDLVLEWRNRPDVRHFMYTHHEISVDEHHRWFSAASRDPARRLLIGVDEHDVPVGVVTFSDIDFVSKVATWGLYMSPAAARGTGTQIGHLGLSRAFEELGLSTLNSEVLGFNTRSLDFHRKLGFRLEEVLVGHYLRDGRRHDVHRLALSRDAWREQSRPPGPPGAGH